MVCFLKRETQLATMLDTMRTELTCDRACRHHPWYEGINTSDSAAIPIQSLIDRTKTRIVCVVDVVDEIESLNTMVTDFPTPKKKKQRAQNVGPSWRTRWNRSTTPWWCAHMYLRQNLSLSPGWMTRADLSWPLSQHTVPYIEFIGITKLCIHHAFRVWVMWGGVQLKLRLKLAT